MAVDLACRTLVQRGSILLAVVLLVGGGQVLALDQAPRWADRNDSKAEATLIEFRQSYRGYLWPKKDHDFYRLLAPTAGLLRIRVAGLASNCAAAVKVHDHRRTVQRWVNGERGKDLNLTCPLRERGSYWIELADSKDTNYSTQAYTLEVDFQAVVDGNEPNDSKETESPVELPATIEGFLFPQRDCDRFRFYLPERGCLRLILTGIEPKAGSKVMVLGEGGRKVTGEGSTLQNPRAGGWVIERTVGYQKLLININHSGYHSLLLRHVKSFVSLLPYRLRLEFFKASLDEHEPNDDLRHASRIYPGQRVKGYVLPALDRDVYKVYVRGHGRLVVRQHGLRGGLNSALNIIDPRNGYSLSDGWRHAEDGAKEQELQIPIKGWGNYVIKVGSPFSREASIDPYELEVFFLNKLKGAPWVPNIQGLPRSEQ